MNIAVYLDIKSFIVLSVICVFTLGQGQSAYCQFEDVGKGSLSSSYQVYRNGIIHVGELNKNINNDSTTIKWLGTAFLVDDNCTFATAKHIFRNADKNRIILRFRLPKDRSTIRTLEATIIYEDKQTDLAFLKINQINNNPCRSGDLHAFKLVSEVQDTLTGQTVVIIGHPTLASKSEVDIAVLRSGIISSCEIKWDLMPMLLLDLQGVPGFSGSPVIIQETGEVVGVVFGPGPTKRLFGFEWATPITKSDYFIAVGDSINR